ncbi:MAG TPA: hypothetical protein VKY37_07550 [Brumimicrobium sp.]|nr:hypothetical protein [Brumimicrobium sp.]
MKNKIYTFLIFMWMGLTIIAQTPQGVVQNDKEQKNFWESNTAMIIGGLLILILIIARGWSKRIHKRRDEIIKKKKEDN